MKKLFVLTLSLLLIMSFAAPIWGQNTLRVATEAGFMPFAFVDEKTGRLLGFDMDLIQAIAETLGWEVTIDNIHWDGLIPALLNKNYDVCIAGMTITEERAASVNFSDPYFESVLTIVAQVDDDVQGLEDLAGKIAAVQINTTGDFEATDLAEEGLLKNVARFDTVPDAMQAVLIGAADVIIVDLPVAESYLAANPGAPLKHLGALFTNEFYGIALHKENTALLEQINSALAQLQAEGTYQQIFDKWFGSE